MSNLNINPNFNIKGFENPIHDFNKVFSNSLNQQGENFNQIDKQNTSFQDVFNNVGVNQVNSMEPIQAQANMFVGMDTINAQKIDMSPTAKLAHDIGSGISNSIDELNTVQKQAETDFETFASGGDISVHEVMISAQKSNLAMQMAIQLRNQFLTTYNEFKNMTI